MPFSEVAAHYQRYPYPIYPLLASIRRCDTYSINLTAIWGRFNGQLLPEGEGRILIAGSGAFEPYPMAVSNRKRLIDAVDLAASNLRRARLHCLLHGRFNVSFFQGDLLDPTLLPGPYHFIESFGVLHHLDDPAAGLAALGRRLLPGGVVRVMVYGRYARQEVESIRRAMRLLKVRQLSEIKSMLKRAAPDSRLRRFYEASWEAKNDSGLADLFLHPKVKSYRIDQFLEMVRESGLEPLLFAHTGAVEDPVKEIERLRGMERRGEAGSNIICYLGNCCRGAAVPLATSRLLLNQALADELHLFRIRPFTPIGRMGHENRPVDRKGVSFLRRFIRPVPEVSLTAEERRLAESYLRSFFLVRLTDL